MFSQAIITDYFVVDNIAIVCIPPVKTSAEFTTTLAAVTDKRSRVFSCDIFLSIPDGVVITKVPHFTPP
jgi:hypothetical protein